MSGCQALLRHSQEEPTALWRESRSWQTFAKLIHPRIQTHASLLWQEHRDSMADVQDGASARRADDASSGDSSSAAVALGAPERGTSSAANLSGGDALAATSVVAPGQASMDSGGGRAQASAESRARKHYASLVRMAPSLPQDIPEMLVEQVRCRSRSWWYPFDCSEVFLCAACRRLPILHVPSICRNLDQRG